MAVNKASKLNDVSCENISKIDDVLKSNIRYFDNNDFSCQQTTPTPTPTPTITPTSTPPSVTPTPTPTQANIKCARGHIPKETVYSYTSCCYPYGQISGTSGPDTDGYDVCYFPFSASTGVTLSSPVVVCETSGLTSCCEILLGYDINDQLNACSATQATYYISNPCLTNSCRLPQASAIYTDDSCTTLADDGVYSDGTDYGTQSGGVFTYVGLC